MLYSPLSYSGLGIIHPYYLQHIKHLHVCMEQTVNSNITHNLLDSNVEQLRLDLGIDSSSGNWHFPQASHYLTPCWMNDLFHFCSDHNICLKDNCTPLTLRTTQDRFLMEAFLPHFKPYELARLNHCQKHLQVITLSDITIANGTHLETAMVSGQSRLFPRSRLQ